MLGKPQTTQVFLGLHDRDILITTAVEAKDSILRGCWIDRRNNIAKHVWIRAQTNVQIGRLSVPNSTHHTDSEFLFGAVPTAVSSSLFSIIPSARSFSIRALS
jgi:hypothetical protein